MVSLQAPRISFGETKRFEAPGIHLPKPDSASIFFNQKGYFTVFYLFKKQYSWIAVSIILICEKTSLFKMHLKQGREVRLGKWDDGFDLGDVPK
jgi:hypothetical protein